MLCLEYELENGNTFTYEVNSKEAREAIEKIFAITYKVSETTASDILYDLDLFDKCEERFEEQLKDYFSRKAYESYEDDEKYPTDADKFGVKQSWFV